MFCKCLFNVWAFVIGWCALIGNVDAQYYYDPGFYQPQMYVQPQMVYPATMDSYAREPELQSLVQESPIPNRRRGVSRTVNHSSMVGLHEDLPGIAISQTSEAGEPTVEAAQAGKPLPDCKDGAIHILDIPDVAAQSHCCPDSTTGNCDKDLTRFPSKQAAIDAGCDPECLVCVKEPFLCTKTVMDCAEVVFFRCYKRTVPFNDKRCEDQRCIQEVGERTVKKLEPCTVKINFPCKKTVIDYREVWICIKCKDGC